jgi:hypothetical protein
MAGSCEYGIVSSGSIKDGELFYYLSDYQLLKDSVPWT